MPYHSLDDLPQPIQMHLPLQAQEIYRSAFNRAWVNYATLPPVEKDQAAHRVAWAAVKRCYRKAGHDWVERSEPDEL